MKRKKLFFAMLCFASALGMRAQSLWTDKSSVITNPSFETDDAVTDATKNGLNSATVTGWTILPATTVSNAQAATVNSSSTLSVLSGSDGATTGSKYFYVRQNWNASGNFGIEQTIPSENLPAGLYLLTCKIKTSSSDPNSSHWYLSIQEEGNDAVTNSKAGSAAEWLNYGVVLYKESSSTTLTISAYMVAGASGQSRHYAMLLDDFELKYMSPTDMGSVSSSNTLDLTGAIYNEGIYNSSKTALPRGWQEYGRSGGNGNYTEGTGNTQLEGWADSNNNFSRDYYQTINNLPEGKYTVSAKCHDTNGRGAFLYIYSDGTRQSTNMTTDYSVITTPALYVTNGSINAGIKIENKKGTWMTGDDFQLTYLGIQPVYDEALAAATTARDDIQYTNVLGKEKSDLLAAIALSPSTYEDYQEAITTLNNATAVFTGAKDIWNACATEYTHYTVLSGTAEYNSFITSSTTGQDVLNAIKTAEYTVVTTKYDTDGSALFIPSWDKTNFDSRNDQHWCGTTREYFDYWNGSAFNSSISKTVTLPEGHYAFYAAGRGQSNSPSAVTLKVVYPSDSPTTSLTQSYTMKGDTGKGIDTSGAANFGEGTFANSGAGRGWEWRYIAFDLAEETSVTLSIEGSGNNSWIGACDAKLLTYENVEVSRRLYMANKETAEAARDNSDYDNVVGTERTALVSAIDATPEATYSGYLSAATTLETATKTFTAAKSSYDALVAEIAHAKTLSVATATADGYAATSTSTVESAYANVQALNVEEYTAVTTKYDTDGSALFIPSWDKTNFGSRKDQHWCGTEREYFDYWNGSAFNSSISKTVTLPEGHYAFYAAGRGQANSPSAVTLKVVYPSDSPTTSLTQSYTMKGDTGKGIDTSGAANFGEGTFANNGAGRGWEWRYIAFDLDEETSVTLSIEGSGNNSWIGACDTKLLTYENVEVSRRLYVANKEIAETARDDASYTNVTGTERTALNTAINASVTETYEGYNVAAAALETATTTFVNAKVAYDAYVAAKAVVYPTLTYAATAKRTVLDNAQDAETATSASDAESKTAAIQTAARKYYESHALAEGVAGAENKTSLIKDPNMDVTYDGTEHTFGAWQVFSQVDGTISLKTEADQPLTDGDGNKYKYADIWKADNNGGIKQTVSIPAGKYLLTAAARAQNVAGATFGLFAGDARTEIPKMDNTGGVYGNGWNDVSVEFFVTTTTDVEIGVLSGNGKTMWWGATRFRLVRLGDATESVTVSPVGYATYASDYPLDFTDSDIDAYIATTRGDGTGVTFTQVNKVPANTGVLLHKAGGDTDAIPFFSDSADDTEGNVFVRGTGGAVATEAGDCYNYILNNKNGNLGFYRAAGQTVATNRAYISILKSESSSVKEFFSLPGFDDDATAVESVNANVNDNNAVIYNVAGQRLNKVQKGINIVNGKKLMK